ncbi:hypothetical protein H311_01422, partial [Anncaliia algerae PRA109]
VVITVSNTVGDTFKSLKRILYFIVIRVGIMVGDTSNAIDKRFLKLNEIKIDTMNHRELVKITADYGGTIKWLLEKKILPDKMICTCRLNVEMTLVKKTGKFFWRCCKCDKVKSILSDTIFYKSKLQPNKIIDLIYFWCRDFKQNESSSEIKTRSKKTCMEWYGKLQKLAYSIMKNEKRSKIGGVGKIVEIDESKFSKRKYNV